MIFASRSATLRMRAGVCCENTPLDSGKYCKAIAAVTGAGAVSLRADNVAALRACLRLLATDSPDDLPATPLELLAVIVEAHRLELSDWWVVSKSIGMGCKCNQRVTLLLAATITSNIHEVVCCRACSSH
eukprot:3987357-Amphidinium_carterae.1